MKVILILPYSSLVTGRDFKVDLFGEGFHIKIAQQIWERTQKYQLECWRPERKLKEAITGERDGIIYRAFPSFRPTLGFLDRHVWRTSLATFPPARFALWREYSLSMLRQLKKVCQKEEVLIHFCGFFSEFTHLLALNCSNVPVVAAHGGGPPPSYSAWHFITHLPVSLLEQRAAASADVILASSRWIYERLSKLYPKANIKLMFPYGINFEKFKPLAKETARQALGIPSDKKGLLYVGRYDSVKGVDLSLKIYQELKKRYDLSLLLVGGLKSDPLYDEAISSGAIVCEQVPQPELVTYYSAADIYLFPKFYSSEGIEDLEEWMGIGTAPLESLACGTPVVGTNLKHFLGTDDELKRVGKIPSTPDDVAKCIVDVLKHPELYQDCREIARKYYSWEGVAEQLVDIYDNLFERYYSQGLNKQGPLI